MATRRQAAAGQGRPQVEDPNAALAALRPAARPVSLYFRPNLRRPDIDNAFEQLAALSPRLTQILATLNDEARQENRQAGAAAFADPIRRRDVLERRFGKLVRDGEIREAESPFFQMGFFEASAQSMVDRYRTAVLAEVPKLAQVADAEGNVVSPGNLEFRSQEIWTSLAENNEVTLANFFGERRAQLLRGEVDRELQNAFHAQVAQNTEQAHHRQKGSQLTTQMMELAAVTEPVQLADHLQGLSDYVTNEIWSANFADPWGVVVDSALAATNVIAAQDPERAAALLDQLKMMRVGTTALGQARTDLRNKIALHETSLDAQIRTQISHQDSVGRAQVNEAVRRERDVYGKELHRAKLEGGVTALREVYDDHVRRLLDDPTRTASGVGYGDEVLDDLTALYERLREPDPLVQDSTLRELTSMMREPDAAVDEALETALTQGLVSFPQYDQLRQRWQQVKSYRDFTFGFDPYQQELRFMSEGYNPADFSPSARLELMRERQGNIRQFQEAYEAELEAVVREVGLDDREGVRNRMQSWIRSDGSRFAKRSTDLGEQLRKRGAENRDRILSGISAGGDMSNEIEEAFRRGDLTAQQKFSLLAQQHANLNEIQNTQDAVASVLDEVSRRLFDQAPVSFDGPPQLTAAQLQTLENLREDVAQAYQGAYVEEREGKNPIDFARAWDRRQRQLRRQFLEQVETPAQRRQRRFSEQGVEDEAERERRVGHLRDSRDFADTGIQFNAWDDVAASAPVVWRDPSGFTPSFFYDDVAEALEDKFGGVGAFEGRDRLRRRELARWVAVRAEELSAQQKASIMVTMGANVGFRTREVIDNRVRLAGSPGAGLIDVDLRDVPINPYWTSVFTTQGQLDMWLRQVPDAEMKGDLTKLFGRLGIPWDSTRYPNPIDDPEILEFYEYQKDALERVR